MVASAHVNFSLFNCDTDELVDGEDDNDDKNLAVCC